VHTEYLFNNSISC